MKIQLYIVVVVVTLWKIYNSEYNTSLLFTTMTVDLYNVSSFRKFILSNWTFSVGERFLHPNHSFNLS